MQAYPLKEGRNDIGSAFLNCSLSDQIRSRGTSHMFILLMTLWRNLEAVGILSRKKKGKNWIIRLIHNIKQIDRHCWSKDSLMAGLSFRHGLMTEKVSAEQWMLVVRWIHLPSHLCSGTKLLQETCGLPQVPFLVHSWWFAVSDTRTLQLQCPAHWELFVWKHSSLCGWTTFLLHFLFFMLTMVRTVTIRIIKWTARCLSRCLCCLLLPHI